MHVTSYRPLIWNKILKIIWLCVFSFFYWQNYININIFAKQCVQKNFSWTKPMVTYNYFHLFPITQSKVLQDTIISKNIVQNESIFFQKMSLLPKNVLKHHLKYLFLVNVGLQTLFQKFSCNHLNLYPKPLKTHNVW